MAAEGPVLLDIDLKALEPIRLFDRGCVGFAKRPGRGFGNRPQNRYHQTRSQMQSRRSP